MKKLKYSELLFVSQNKHKHDEFKEILGIPDLRWSNIYVAESQNINLSGLVEEKIQTLKSKLPNIPFFVEHTGLIIEAWKGLPGGLTRPFMNTVGCEGICRMMKDYKDNERHAIARAIIGFYHPKSDHIISCTGEVFGTIAEQPRGNSDFGWDPIFIPEGDSRTYAEMTITEKNETSMRKNAMSEFVKYLDKYFEV